MDFFYWIFSLMMTPVRFFFFVLKGFYILSGAGDYVRDELNREKWGLKEKANVSGFQRFLFETNF